MKGNRKKSKIPSLARVTLAENVRIRMDEKYASARSKPRALAKEAGIGLFTVQRVLDAQSGANLDTIEAIGNVLGAEPHELLTPGWAKRRRQPTLAVAAPRKASGTAG